MQQISEMQKLMSHKFRRHTLLTFTKSYTAKTFQDMTADEFSGYHCSKVLHSSVSSIDHDPCCFHRIFFLQTEIIVFILHCIYACVSWMICIPYNRISHWNEHFFFAIKCTSMGAESSISSEALVEGYSPTYSPRSPAPPNRFPNMVPYRTLPRKPSSSHPISH